MFAVTFCLPSKSSILLTTKPLLFQGLGSPRSLGSRSIDISSVKKEDKIPTFTDIHGDTYPFRYGEMRVTGVIADLQEEET